MSNYEERLMTKRQQEVLPKQEAVVDIVEHVENREELAVEAAASRESDEAKSASMRAEFNRENVEDENGNREPISISQEDVKASKRKMMKVSTQEREAELLEHKKFLDTAGATELNRMLAYTKFGDDILLHVSPSRTLQLSEKLGFLHDGFEKLVDVLESDLEIRQIRGSSWVIKKNPHLLEKLGFTVRNVPLFTRIMRNIIYFLERENKPGAYKEAFMSREDFLERYGKGLEK